MHVIARLDDAPARDITQRVAVAVIGRSPIARQKAFKKERGWHNLKFYATTDDAFPKDYRGLAPDDSEWPILAVFRKVDGKVRLFWASELGGDLNRSRTGPARRARPGAALDYPRYDAGGARCEVVSEAGILAAPLLLAAAPPWCRYRDFF